jgi:hypothetical protein
MPITLINNKKNRRVSFVLKDKTESLVKENEKLSKEVHAKISVNEELDSYFFRLHQKLNKDLKDLKKDMQQHESKGGEY